VASRDSLVLRTRTGAINIPSLRDPSKQQFDRVAIDTVAAHHESDQRILDQVGEGHSAMTLRMTLSQRPETEFISDDV
jgi:hypothetical protein